MSDKLFTTTTLKRALHSSGETIPDAWADLVNYYGPQIDRIASKYTTQRADVEEIVSDVLCQLWSSRTTFKGRSDGFLGWVLVITKSKCVNHYRQRKARETKGLVPVGGSSWAQFVQQQSGSAALETIDDYATALEAALTNPLLYSGQKQVAICFYDQLSDLNEMAPEQAERIAGLLWERLAVEAANAYSSSVVDEVRGSVEESTFRCFLLRQVLSLPSKLAAELIGKAPNTVDVCASRVKRSLESKGNQ